MSVESLITSLSVFSLDSMTRYVTYVNLIIDIYLEIKGIFFLGSLIYK